MYRKNKNVPTLLAALKRAYPDAHCELNFRTPLELLVATILSAQCTDKRVNLVTPALFERYPSAKDYAAVPQEKLESEIRATGFFRSKSKSIRTMAKLLVEKHKGAVPKTMDDLLELPGVARKTANVVMGNAFGLASGIVVDTHVARLSGRLGLSKQTDPVKIEKELVAQVPKDQWIWFSHALIWHGRRVCTARSPRCPECPVRKECANPVNL
jgi:endonuclease-3